VALPLPILRSATEISRAGNRPVRPRPKPEFLGRLASTAFRKLCDCEIATLAKPRSQ